MDKSCTNVELHYFYILVAWWWAYLHFCFSKVLNGRTPNLKRTKKTEIFIYMSFYKNIVIDQSFYDLEIALKNSLWSYQTRIE